MNLNVRARLIIIFCLIIGQACSVQKSRKDISKTGLFFHNLTAKYNGYFNANELLTLTEATLAESYKDDYNKILELYEYNGVADASSVSANMDLAIKKASRVINLHRPSHWVPDSYLLIGQAQYFKQHYETAEETFKFMVNNYNDLHVSKAKKTREQAAKDRAIRVVEQQEKKEAEKEAREKEKKKEDKVRKEKQKTREQENKEKAKERERLLKERKKAAKAGKPLPKKTPSTTPSKTTTPPPTTDSLKNIAKTPPLKKTKAKEEEDEKKEAATQSDKKGKASKKHRPVLQDAQLWLAKTYIMRKNSIAAGILLGQLKSDPGLYEELRPEIPVLQAYNHIREEEYEEAVPFLKEALTIDKIPNRKKARIAFVLGQILSKLHNPAESFEAFDKVTSYNPSYELDFFSRLHRAKQGVASGKANKDALLAELKRMIKDDKNIDYGVAIYHTMAQVYLLEGNRSLAKDHLILALQQQGDATQRTEVTYELATLYYEDQDYLKAKNYYDSTLNTITEKDIRKPEVTKLSASLTDIAQHIAVIQVQDSMLKISTWPEKEQKQWARKIIKAKEESGNPKAGMLATNSLNQVQPKGSNIDLTPAGAKSSFFAYDDKALKKGIKDFERIWGTIKLQDNWRVSAKAGLSLSSNDLVANPNNETVAAPTDNEDLDALLSQIPNEPDQKELAYDKIRNSMFQLGILYREKLENLDKAISTLEEIITRYPGSNIEQDVLYQLYLASLQAKDQVRADKYKNRILQEYPGSKYAQSILNPDALTKQVDKVAQLHRYYDETYTMFSTGQCNEALDRVQHVDSLFKDNPLRAKFAMLQVMCTGKSQGKDAYIMALKDFIARYPQSEERDKAKDMLRYLMGDEKAFETVDIIKNTADPNAFEYVADELHYVIVIVFDKKESTLSDLKISISEFNQRYFQNDDLKISNIFFDQDATIPVIMIRKYDDAAKAFRYYETVKNNERHFIKPEINHELYAISQSNYRKLYASKDLIGYKAFFKTYYDK